MKLKVYPASSFNEHLKAAQKILCFVLEYSYIINSLHQKCSNIKRLKGRHFQLYFQSKLSVLYT
jgi:hypothetical protein